MSNALPNKTVLITGGSSGLGFECARSMLDRGGWQVMITSPNINRAKRAATRLCADTGKNRVQAAELRLHSLQDIRRFAKDFSTLSLPPLKGIICNAGVQLRTYGSRTEDGIEMIFGVNHLGHFLLVNLMFKQLQPAARILFVSSSMHDRQRFKGARIPPYTNAIDLAFASSDKNPIQAYALSKLCNLLCAYELDNRLQQQGISQPEHPISVNVFDPGLMPGTALARNQSILFRWFWRRVLPLLSSMVSAVNRPQQSGMLLAELMTDEKLADLTGRYFEKNTPVASSAESYDLDKARELWESSVRLTGLTASESALVA